MAVFLLNICKFNGCGITFPSLSDLITHIEDTHIDYDPKVVEQKEQSQPACLPLSYVLRFISEDARKDGPFLSANTAGVELKRKLAIKHHSYSMSSSNRSNTPTGSEMDDDEMVVTESEDSNESWTTEEFSSEFIMRYGSRHSGNGNAGTPGNEKPFACPVPGCKKRYKNVNGIKYHSKNGHKKDGKVRKGYKCHCGKSYKTAQGLKNHALLAHNSTSETAAISANANANGNGAGSGGVLVQRSSSPSQSLGSLSPSSISNMSSSASSCHGSNGTHNGNNAAVLHQLTTNTGSINLQQQLINNTAISNSSNNNSSSNNANNQQQISNGLSQNHNSIQTNAHAQHHAIVTTATATAQTTETPSLSTPASAIATNSFINTTTLATTASTITTTTTAAATAAAPASANTSTCSPISTNAITSNCQFPATATANYLNTKRLPLPIQQPLLGTTLRAPTLVPATARVSNHTMPAATAATVAATAPTPAAASIISPTFIEHKYSANVYKEKFMSHMRNNTTNSVNHKQNPNNSSPRKIFSNTTTTCNVAANPSNESNSRTLNTSVADNRNNNNLDELCSIQQLNESFKNNLFQKTIN